MRIGLLLVVTVTLLVSACSDTSHRDEIVCTTQLVPGIVIEIRDASSGASIAETAEGEAIDQDGVQYAFEAVGDSVATAYEAPGVFVVNVRHDGYVDWSVGGVLVESDECHVITEFLTAFLEPETAP